MTYRVSNHYYLNFCHYFYYYLFNFKTLVYSTYYPYNCYYVVICFNYLNFHLHHILLLEPLPFDFLDSFIFGDYFHWKYSRFRETLYAISRKLSIMNKTYPSILFRVHSHLFSHHAKILVLLFFLSFLLSVY